MSPLLFSNNDQLERARAAAIRRKSILVVSPPPLQSQSDPLCFSKEQITELFTNCIKLASENKINQKNTWELRLIDHICEIIRIDTQDDNDVETNFQKASCTLEAGVKIYASRVDSVHSEAYKVLGGINRAGRDDVQVHTPEVPDLYIITTENILDGDQRSGQGEGHSKKDVDRKMSPLSTLESSFEALNVKKFDVDPLYHQTSAQFDEGGAKGLLLNNLGVYGGCRVVFDSFEVPGKSMYWDGQSDTSDKIDVSFAKDYIEQMVINVRAKDEISPTLRSIINQFDEDNRRPLNTFCIDQRERGQDDAANQNHANSDGNADAFDNFGDSGLDQDDQSSVVDESSNYGEPVFPNHQEAWALVQTEMPGLVLIIGSFARLKFVQTFLSLSEENVKLESRACCGQSLLLTIFHCPEGNTVTESGSTVTAKKPNCRKQVEPDLNFTNCLEKEMPDIFAPPKNLKSLLLPANRVPCKTTLPEDCHYQPENLVKLFLLPNTLVILC
ncbi:hypothetical protein IFM89_022137 [Coptis chinensis]|uniref:Condensin complex subunit 2 n=1 Tax=Coptis chinensis TaxID=261450 RepID=A0A835I597_9MAGN|nr:hypothetical protein IFM89_022137 [Coptis chinensis]